MLYILYNGLSKSGKNQKNLDELVEIVKKENKEYVLKNIIEIKNCGDFLKTINDDDEAVIVGGDGTVHYVANQLQAYLPITFLIL